MRPSPIVRLCVAVAYLSAAASAARGQVIVPGDIYTSNSSAGIQHYAASGAYVGTISISASYGSGVKGLTAAPNGLLYATVANGSSGYNVVALNSAGSVVQSYTAPDYVAGNISFGKISFSNDGQQFFVAGQNNLRQFAVGNSASSVIYTNNQVFASTPLPSGDRLVLSAYQLQRINSSGTVLQTITPGGGFNLVDGRGLAYNAATNDIFLTMLGSTGQFFQILKLNGTTGALEGSATYNYADDLCLTGNNRLLVGSRTLNPAIFDLNLNLLGTFGSNPELFVTFVPVPEPGCLLLVSAAAFGTARFARSRRRKRES